MEWKKNEEVKNSLRTVMPARVEFYRDYQFYILPCRAWRGSGLGWGLGWSYDRPKAETSPLTGQGLEVVL